MVETAAWVTAIATGLTVVVVMVGYWMSPLMEGHFKRPKVRCLDVLDNAWYYSRTDDGSRITGAIIAIAFTVENRGREATDVTCMFEPTEQIGKFVCDLPFRLAEHSEPRTQRIHLRLQPTSELPKEGSSIEGHLVLKVADKMSRIYASVPFNPKAW